MQERITEFEEADIALTASTYDDVEQNASFKSSEKLTYPLLSDQDAKTVKSLGILDESYEEGSSFYGVSHPGVILVDSDDKIVLTRAEHRFEDSESMDDLFEDVKELIAVATTEEEADTDENNED